MKRIRTSLGKRYEQREVGKMRERWEKYVEAQYLGKRKPVRGVKKGENLNPLRETSIDPWFQQRKLVYKASAKVETSFPSVEVLGIGAIPLREVGFIGRSNVGKSSLLNSLCYNRAQQARVKDHPGVTQSLNWYVIANAVTLIDMPGYGFSYTKEETREEWMALISRLYEQRKTLRKVFMIVDGRHGIKPLDREHIATCQQYHQKVEVVVNKCDLVPPRELIDRLVEVEMELKQYKYIHSQPIPLSSKNLRGVSTLRNRIYQLYPHLS